MKMIHDFQRFGEGSSIRVGSSVYVYPGVFEAGNSEVLIIQRIDFAEDNIQESIKTIKSLGLKAGISIKPSSSEEIIEPYLDYCDLVLVMTVEPGFGGQKFMSSQLEKIKNIKEMINNKDRNILIEVDGGINLETSKLCIEAGANVLVAGSAIFSQDTSNYSKLVKSLRNET